MRTYSTVIISTLATVILSNNVMAGSGAWTASGSDISVEANNHIYIKPDSPSSGSADDTGEVIIDDNATAETADDIIFRVTEGAQIEGNLTIGTGAFGGNTTIHGNSTLNGTLDVTGSSSLSTLSTSGQATLNSTSITNNATVGGTFSVTTGDSSLQNTSITGTLGVTGDSSLQNTSITGTLGVTGATTINGATTISIGGSKLDVQSTQTTVSGGSSTATATNLVLDNDGATFSGSKNGDGNVIISGVADGVNPNDAVNKSQLDNAILNGGGITQTQLNAATENLASKQELSNVATTAYQGISATAAMSAIPDIPANANGSFGIGAGYYQGEQSIAAGIKVKAIPGVTVTMAAGAGVKGTTFADPVINTGLAWSW